MPLGQLNQSCESNHFTGKELLRRTKSAARPTVQNMRIARLRYAPHLVNPKNESVSQKGSNYSNRAISETNRGGSRKHSSQPNIRKNSMSSQKSQGKIKVHRILSNENNGAY